MLEQIREIIAENLAIDVEKVPVPPSVIKVSCNQPVR